MARGKGFALGYVLLLVAVLVTLFSAVLVRVSQSLRLATHDFELVRARGLSEVAAELAFNLMRERPLWFEDEAYGEPPFTNEDFGPDFAREVVGGTFEITVLDREDLDPDPFETNNSGTYKVIVSRARVGNRSAQTVLSVKLTNAFIHHLVAARGTYYHEPDVLLSGPVFVDWENGMPGNFQFAPSRVIDRRANTGRVDWDLSSADVLFGGEVRATGEIFMQSIAPNRFLTAGRLPIEGNKPAGFEKFHRDVDQSKLDAGRQTGKLHLTRDSRFESHVGMALLVNPMDELLATYRLNQGGVHTLDVGAYPDGVLVEFLPGGGLMVSRGVWKDVGRCYDRAYYQANERDVLQFLRERYENDKWESARTIAEAEVAWNDPAYPEERYPALLEKSSDTGSERGDYFDVKRLVRDGDPLFQTTLSNEKWTVLRLVSSRAGYSTADRPARLTAPPIFVRGVVDGKAVVVYDEAQPGSDGYPTGGGTTYHMYIHAEHEDPDDAPGDLMVPGGLHYANRELKREPEARGSFSDDQVILLCRGSLRGSGLNGEGLSYLVQGNDRVNYRQRLRNLDDLYVQRYSDEEYRLGRDNLKQDWPVTHFDGIGISHWSAWNRDWVTAGGQIVVSRDLGQENRAYFSFDGEKPDWGTAFKRWPDEVKRDKLPSLPTYMRCASAPEGCDFRVFGGVHGVGVPLELKGVAFYDYRWRNATAEEIKEEIQLPVGPLLLDQVQ